MNQTAEPLTWDAFFAVQRSVLQRSVNPEGIDPSSDTAPLAQACSLLCPKVGIRSIVWEMHAIQDNWVCVGQWSDATLPAPSNTPVAVELNEAGRTHRFTAQLESVGSLPDQAMLLAACSTLKSAVELHGHAEMSLADARNGGDELGHASVDQDGNVLFANERFQALIRRVEPEWDGQQLPMPLDQSPNAIRHGMTWKGLFFYVDPNSSHIQLRARPDRRLPDLSPRELEVARLIASGMTFKEVARQLEMAPSTASTHLYKVYDKLGISRRSSLVEWLQENAEVLQQPGAAEPRPRTRAVSR